MTVASSTAEPATARDLRRMPSPDFSVGYSSQRGSGTSIDELLRQQNELDKSIAALRLFSPRSSFAPTLRDNRPESGTVDPMPSGAPSDSASVVVKVIPSRGTSTSDMSGKTTAASGQSSFSLSVFPAPPPASGGVSASPSPLPSARPLSPPAQPRASLVVPSSPLGATSSPMGLSPLPMGLSLSPLGGISPTLSNHSPTRGRTEDFPQSVTLQPPKPGESALSSPATPTSRGGRVQSGGTQYDVTSFIVPRSFEGAGRLAGLASPARDSPMVPVTPVAEQRLPNTPVTPQVMPSTPGQPVTPSQPIPMSPVTPLPNSGRMRSEVTQYDVTSFIGNLTSPGNETTASPLPVNVERTAIPSQAFPTSVGSSRPSTVEQSSSSGPSLPSHPAVTTERARTPPRSNSLPEESSTSAAADAAPSGPILRPLRLTSGGPPVTNAPPVEPRPTRHVRISSVTKEVAPLKPLFLGGGPGLPPRSAIKPTAHNRSNSYGVPPTSYGMPPGPRRQGSNNSLRPAKPLVISVPRPLAQEGEDDSGAYERPRAVPNISQEDNGPL
ncbi:hypothetical protein HDZ31DRAFT_28231 [Schizophyllum fasciatum]